MNKTSKKKCSTSGEIPHHQKLINGTTPEAKSEAEILFDKIGTGKENAIRVSHRDNNDVTSRSFRKLVADANRQGDSIINEGDGAGYYRPNMDRPEEAEAARHYVHSLLSKADKLERAAYGIAATLGGKNMIF